MNHYLIIFLITLGSIVPAYFILKAIFGKSIMLVVGFYSISFTLFCCFFHYIVGFLGLKSLFWVTPLCFAVGTLVYLYINKILKMPLSRMIDKVKDLSEGNLSIKITETDAKYELGLLNTSIKQLIENLNKVVSEVKKTTENLAKSSNDLNSNSRQLAESASEQASSVEEVSATMEQMAANIENNNSNAMQTEAIAVQVSQGLQQVSTASKESLESVHAIADKISVINDIAFQTNILALNAAVEAARAGDLGKGFAVVAMEVRKLAVSSKAAADEIVRLANQSVSVTEESGQLMFKLVPDIEKTTSLIQEIATASMEQNNGANQVNNAIQQLNTVTQQNASSSEHMSASAEDLSAQAEHLNKVISYFKISDSLKNKRR